jgi:DNA/RNA endonuclease YhcR with UshA esterase domain
MRKLYLGTLVVTSLVLAAGLASAQYTDIGDIQSYTAAGDPNSAYFGQEVTIAGTVYVARGTYNFGTYYIQDDTGGVQLWATGDLYPDFIVGDVVEVTGTVDYHWGEIQIGVPNEETAMVLLDHTAEPIPEEHPAANLPENFGLVGLFVAVTGEVVSVTDDGGDDQFELDAGGGTSLLVFVDNDTGIDISGVNVGDIYQVLSPCTTFWGTIQLKPRIQSDLIENPGGDSPPVIQNVLVDDWVPMANDPLTVTADITDDNSVDSAVLFYRDSDGGGTGSFSSAAMSNTVGDVWSAIIPAPHTMSQIDYYVLATDDADQSTSNPGAAPDDFHEVAVGYTPIYDLQYVDPGSPTGPQYPTLYLDKVLNIRGVVTFGTGAFGAGATSRLVVQEQDPGPDGTYAWGGVLVYEEDNPWDYFSGDVVEIGGYGYEFAQSEGDAMTELLPHRTEAIYLVDFGQDLPPVTRVQTRVMADAFDGEPYESVLMQTYPSQVMLVDLAHGEFAISSSGALADTLWVDPTIALSSVPLLGAVVAVTGYMDDTWARRDLRPPGDGFVQLLPYTAVDDLPAVAGAGGFVSIAPNPFNPQTVIKFALTGDNLAQLNIYNIRGEKVRTLIQERLSTGEYTLTWDGRSDTGQALASGQYFARLRIGVEVTQVRKLSLVK